MTTSPAARIVVIGSGVAGLSAALSAAENAAPGTSIDLLERADPAEAGGLTRWTAAYLRLDELDVPAEGFVSDIVSFSDGRSPQWYPERLVEKLGETMSWASAHGATFDRLPTYFINSNRGRLQPVGGGKALLDVLLPAATERGVTVRYGTTATGLEYDGTKRLTGVRVAAEGGTEVIPADAVIIASGGFEGNPALLDDALGRKDRPLIPIAPGALFNTGEGITMAIDAGAKRSGEWGGFHAEPVDPRATHAEAIVMAFPYGILVDGQGRRFIDEGRGTIDETYEDTARAIWDLPGGTAYFISDGHFDDEVVRGREGILSRVPPVLADTVEDLAAELGLPGDALAATVAEFNAATDDSPMRWETPDGKSTTGLTPPKSNWATPLDRGPFFAYPVSCAIVFTYGGLATDENGRVVDENDEPLPGLYAVGECTGLYHGKYPGGTSVLRSMIFGRLAGIHAASEVGTRVPV